METYMDNAIIEAEAGIHQKHGGPFGAVVVLIGRIVGYGHIEVLLRNNPTLHGEIVAINNAVKRLDTYDLEGADIYTTAEPCLMCLGACLWANIGTIYYGCSVEDTNAIGFRDDIFDSLLSIDRTELKKEKLKQIKVDDCKALFKEYESLEQKRY